jgi:phosphatidylglycerol---prolipoprotein diacylglyceryl transferase
VHLYILHFGRLILPTFGVLAAVGLMAALTLSLRTAAAVGLSPDRLWNAGLFTILSAFVLSRLLLVITNLRSFFAEPFLLLALPSLTATGILLTILATTIYLRLKNLPLLSTLDAWAPCATLVWTFLSLGHLAEGSDAGLITSVRWSIPSPSGLTRLHPVAFYAAVAAAVITLALLRYLSRHPQPGHTTSLALAASGIAQFIITFFRQPSSDDLPLASILDPIQWVALGMVVTGGLIYIQHFSKLEPRKPVTHAL